MSRLDPQVGDEVLIRGRVKQHIPGVGVDVELFSKTDQYGAWVREDLVVEVISAEQTKTHRGHTVADTRRAIDRLDHMIDRRSSIVTNATDRLVFEALTNAREELASDLTAIGVSAVNPREGQQ